MVINLAKTKNMRCQNVVKTKNILKKFGIRTS